MGEVEPPQRASERARRLEAERHALAVSRAMRARSKVLPTLALLAAVALAYAIPLVLVERGHLEESSLGWVVTTSSLVTFLGGLALALWWQGRPPTIAPPPAQASPVGASPAVVERELRRVLLARLAEERLMATEMRPATGSLDLIIGGSLLGPAIFSVTWSRSRWPWARSRTIRRSGSWGRPACSGSR